VVKTVYPRLFTNPSPFTHLPFIRREGENFLKGLHPF